jgi:hypothetical protein
VPLVAKYTGEKLQLREGGRGRLEQFRKEVNGLGRDSREGWDDVREGGKGFRRREEGRLGKGQRVNGYWESQG